MLTIFVSLLSEICQVAAPCNDAQGEILWVWQHLLQLKLS